MSFGFIKSLDLIVGDVAWMIVHMRKFLRFIVEKCIKWLVVWVRRARRLFFFGEYELLFLQLNEVVNNGG